jgi:ABC-type xylose transport system permease subunit
MRAGAAWILGRGAVVAAGAAGGAAFGLYAGALVNFPTWIACYLLLNDFTYGLAGAWILTGMLWAVLAGAVTGAPASRSVRPSAAA